MRGLKLSEILEDPRAVTLAVLALLAAGLWVATWSAMARMDMAGMAADMAGMSGIDAMDGMNGMSGMGQAMGAEHGAGSGVWSVASVRDASAMWILMMAAMMAPASAPVIAIYAGAAAREDRGLRLALRIALFTLGYFALWGAASIGFALGQLALRDSAWFTMHGTLATPPAAGILMLLAGVYQLTPIKEFCLRHCRHPLTFLLAHWREGLGGAFPVGFRHGLYCVGCCIALMGLMFVFGAMNVWWMAAIAAYFVAEKIAPQAERWSRWAGVLLIVAGALLLAAAAVGRAPY